MPVRTPCPIAPSAAERARLKKMAYDHKTEHRLRVRAQVVLHAAHGRSNACIARETGLHVDTVRRWRVRFAQADLPGPTDRQRCGRPGSFTPLRPGCWTCTPAPGRANSSAKWRSTSLPSGARPSRPTTPPTSPRSGTGSEPSKTATTPRHSRSSGGSPPPTWTIRSPGSTGTPTITTKNPLSHRQRERPPKDLRRRPLKAVSPPTPRTTETPPDARHRDAPGPAVACPSRAPSPVSPSSWPCTSRCRTSPLPHGPPAVRGCVPYGDCARGRWAAWGGAVPGRRG